MDSEHDHYRTYLKIYGYLLMQAADDDEFVKSLIAGDDLGSMMKAVRERIEDSPRY